MKKDYDKKALDVIVTRQKDARNGVDVRSFHILITGKCNSRCLFCSSRKELLNIHFKKEDIMNLIRKGYDEGCRVLVLSGGEPTIHPDLIEFIKFAKGLGYEHVQTTSNGRMFAYRMFAIDVKEAGLNEVTMSIHSHTANVHDRLSGVKNSFEQAINGIRNCKAAKINVRLNIVVNKHNIKNLKETIEFFSVKQGIKRIDLQRLMPFGLAWKNMDFLYYNKNKSRYLFDALEFARKNKVDIRANRFDLKLFKDYPEYMQHTYKFVNEVESKLGEFTDLTKKGKEMYCYPQRCEYCFLEDFCKEIRCVKNRVRSGKIHENDKYFLDNKRLIKPIEFSKYYVKKIDLYKKER